MDLLRFGVAALATWRVAHLVAYEDGPGEVIARTRERLGDSPLGSLMDCFQCTSVWVAAPAAFYVARRPADRVAAWLALSAAACLIDHFVQDEGESDELLRRPAQGVQRVPDITAAPVAAHQR